MAINSALGILAIALLASSAAAQSKDPGLGVNPNAVGATEDVQPGSGPNGSEDWFDTGIDGDGWNPPYLDFRTLVHITRDQFYAGTGQSCQQYDQYFQASGDKYGIDPVILATIAMQESSCQADAGGPTPGLMQVDCSNYPQGYCTDSIADNVDAGTKYLRDQLDASDWNALLAFGSYNGWFTAGSGLNGNRGLTQDYPCSAEGQSNGEPQNLDYLMEVLNGWLLGLDVYGDDNWVGTYRCQGQCSSGNVC